MTEAGGRSAPFSQGEQDATEQLSMLPAGWSERQINKEAIYKSAVLSKTISADKLLVSQFFFSQVIL